jgi:hypothetical protein
MKPTRSAVKIANHGTGQADLPLSRFYRLLDIAFDPPLRTDQTQDPFGPLVMFGDGSLRDLSAAHLDLLRAALGKDSNPAFTARLADILWTYKHGKGQDLLDYAVTAVRAYLDEARFDKALNSVIAEALTADGEIILTDCIEGHLRLL